MSRRSENRYERMLQKKRKNAEKFKNRSYRRNRHHIINKCFGGSKSVENLLTLDTNRHDAWHLLFKNMDFLDVMRLLARTLKMKNHQDANQAQFILEEFTNGTD